MSTFVIINPTAGGGRVGRKWSAIEPALHNAIGAFEHSFTSPELGAKQIAFEAARRAVKRIIAVGGDGTVNEVINGLAEAAYGKQIEPSLGLLSLGTGNDFARAFKLDGAMADKLGALRAGHTREVDLGLVQFTDRDGAKQQRWFGNVANLGLVSEVTGATQNSKLLKLIGGKLAYPIKAISILRHYGGRQVTIAADDAALETLDVLSNAIANAPYFGSGMKIAPHADATDGLFDVILILRGPKLKATDIRLLYTGQHLSHPAVRHFKAKQISFTTQDAKGVLCDADGELFGCLPCHIAIHPKKLRVIA